MKKVLIVVRNSFENDKRVLNIAQTLSDNKCDVTLFAEKNRVELPFFEQKDFKVFRIPLFSSLYSKKKTITNITSNCNSTKKSIINKIRDNKVRILSVSFLNWLTFNIGYLVCGLLKRYHIIYCNDLDTLAVGYFLAKFHKAKLIYDSHEIWLEGNRFQHASLIHQNMWIYLEKKLINKVNEVITTTRYRADYLLEKYNLNNTPRVLRNCPRFKKIKKTNLFRKEFNIPKQIPIFLYQGMLSEKRGIFKIVDVVANIDNIAMVFMGNGNDKFKLIKYIEKKQLESKIFVKDAVPLENLLDYTASADIGLQLLQNTGINHYSTISNKIFEYIMAGLAIVSSDFPELNKIVCENRVGKVVDPSDKNGILVTMKKMIVNCKFEEYKKNAKNISNKYTWEKEQRVIKDLI